MSLSRRQFMINSAAAAAACVLLQAGHRSEAETAASHVDQFEPSWDSLQNYECPEWFRDAKLGIWAHWTAQSVPGCGDWYAHAMYDEKAWQYDYHCKHYGHPSKVGFKDIDHIWHAENWDPDKLIALYKEAGARYFVALAQHHDNFDCFDSAYQPWNSVAIGPKKDIVGGWARAARAAGLRFGVTSHGTHAWQFFETAQGADTSGPLAGVPYDGHLTKEDGVGQWWEGLDPQALYAQNHKVEGIQWDWDNSKGGDNPPPAYCNKFYNRSIDLINKYHPDLLYFDDSILPLYQLDPTIGLRIAAHHYNTSIRMNGGKLDAVLTGKGNLTDQQSASLIRDWEVYVPERYFETPWQTDICIGGWHYLTALYEQHTYMRPDQAIHKLVDIVSKNGNMMLNIPVKGDGTIDDDEVQFLKQLAAWTKVNGEAIFSSRPWKIYGESPLQMRGWQLEPAAQTAREFRFTTQGNKLYAMALAWPDDGKLVVRTLASAAPGIVGQISRVTLLGVEQPLTWQQTANGLEVTLPEQRPCDHVFTLKIEGLDLTASNPVQPAVVPRSAGSAGEFVLAPVDSMLHGNIGWACYQFSLELRPEPVPHIDTWTVANDHVSWLVHVDKAGTYNVAVQASAGDGPSSIVVGSGTDVSAPIVVAQTKSFDDYQTFNGVVKFSTAGDQDIFVKSADPANWKKVNLGTVTLTPTVS